MSNQVSENLEAESTKTKAFAIIDVANFRQAVLPAETLQTVSSKTGVNLSKAKTNLETHGLYWLHCASIHHVVPHAESGRSVETNLVVSCKACQFGKSWYTLNQLGLNLRLPAPDLSTAFGEWSKTVVLLANLK